MKVYDLLHPDGSSWDIDMVEGLLSPYDNGFCAGGLVGFRHRIIWHFTHNGMYQVAIRLFSNISNFHIDGPWQALWIKALPVKECIWRCMRGFISCNSKFLHRGINIGPRCFVAGRWGRILSMLFSNARMLGMSVAQTVSPQPSTGGEVQWRKPLTGKLKCNIDGAVFTNNGVVGWAAIVRSDSGRFVRCIAVFKRRNLDPFMAEVIAAQEALSWVRSCHAKGIILEIDNRGL
ncbi:hypothetical protein Gohar_012995 [Gossypium harknessii]|uniref:RNase H type-1 domain-containing protein n=1 Tax=Gossypium harknessii TaxID=34285 RepID=A0A7J9GYM6_9ROSI|nr:hypothetical protein [Gossypium harknessii]